MKLRSIQAVPEPIEPLPVTENFQRLPGKAQAPRRIPAVRSATTTADAEKHAEIEKWKVLIAAFGANESDACAQLQAATGEEQDILLRAIFPGAAATIRRHSSALCLYKVWAEAEGRFPFPFQYTVITAYLVFLQKTQTLPSRAETFQKAAKFTTARLKLRTPMSMFTDPVVDGLVITSFQRKGMVKEAVPYTVQAVAAFELAVMDSSLARPLRIIAGFARFCIGARLRHGDATRICIEPAVLPHTAFVHECGHAFIETTASVDKTSQSRKRMKRPLPVAAHAWGIATEGWAARWLKLREQAKLDARRDGTLMPACGPDLGFVPHVCMSTDALAIYVKLILRIMSVPEHLIYTRNHCPLHELSCPDYLEDSRFPRTLVKIKNKK